MFLNRTVKGWEKRARLEEAQPRQNALPSLDEVKIVRKTKAEEKSSPKFLRADHESRPISLLTLKSNNPDFRKQMFQSLFLQHYLPKSPKAGSGLAGAWLLEAIRLDTHSPSLNYSLHALSLTRVGRITGHQDLIERGTSAYGIALRALRTALESPKYAGRDETLATCLILSIYEVSLALVEANSEITQT